MMILKEKHPGLCTGNERHSIPSLREHMHIRQQAEGQYVVNLHRENKLHRTIRRQKRSIRMFMLLLAISLGMNVFSYAMIVDLKVSTPAYTWESYPN